MANTPKGPKKGSLIFRPYIRTKDGRIIWAKSYGLKAFPIWVRKPK